MIVCAYEIKIFSNILKFLNCLVLNMILLVSGFGASYVKYKGDRKKY